MMQLRVRMSVMFIALCSSVSVASPGDPVITAPAGKVRGESNGNVHVFRGIPYALPPTGARRWTPPLPMPKWKDVRDGKAFGPACVQPKSRPGSIYSNTLPAMSEDCLTLNIWAPPGAQKLPVFVWIHGGALTTGASSEPMYDGARLAQQGIVFVSINYRLGVLGYMAHPALSAESRRNISGNYGLLDQIAALRWLKDNVAAFGGDPSNVTIAGESAGGLSVMYLMAAPDARDLFAKAIVQSGYMISAPHLRDSPHGDIAAEAMGVWLAGQLGASDLAGLRSLPADAIADTAARAGYFPFLTIDGRVLPRQLVDVFDRGEQAKVPILAGFNSGEIRSLRFLAPQPPGDAAAYESLIRERYADLADDFFRLYPASDLAESILAATRDGLYGWTAERLVAKQTATGVPSFLYYFDHGYPAANEKGLHAFHASEIPYVFGTADRTPPLWPKVPATEPETQLTDAMVSYWSTFARSGVPQADGQPRWPAYGTDRAYMAFESVPRTGTRLLAGMYELNEEVVCRRRVQGGQPWNWNFGIAAPVLAREACRR